MACGRDGSLLGFAAQGDPSLFFDNQIEHGMAAKFKHFLCVDYETFYSKDYSLRHMSPPEYILDPRFQVHLLAVYDLAWPAPRLLLPEQIPSFLAQYPAEETICCSHNALFDLAILSWRYNWVAGRLQDTLGLVRSLRSYRRYSLGEVVKQLFGRDSKGDVIHKVAGMDVAAIKRAGLWSTYCTYALNDVLECSHIYLKLLPEFPEEEQRVMDLVLRAAVQPVLHADIPLLEQHLDALRRRKAALLQDCGYDKTALMSTLKFQQALESLGVAVERKTSATGRSVPAFAKSDPFMTTLLEYEEADDDINFQVQTLAMARLSHRSTIEETRAERFVNIAKLPWGNGPLLPVALRFGGAHTGRLSGEWRMNMQNLPRDKIKSKLRAALCAPPGYQLITADLAQIEARIVACLCGQTNLITAFRNGEDVYASFASTVFKRTIIKKTHPNERFIGKTAILGLGYGCGYKRFYQMVVTQAKQNQIDLEALKFNENTALDIVNTYRRSYPHISSTWIHLDTIMTTDLFNAGSEGKKWGPVTFTPSQIVLPNGMTLRYVKGDPDLYGAKILENITQALARIVIMQAAVRLARKGLRFLLQSHDELVFSVLDCLVPDAKLIIHEEMTCPPAWMPDLPLAVEIGVGDNYGATK
jgi:DNA polymerase family A